MEFTTLRSFAKINVSLKVLGRLNSNLHNIESLISFVDLYDVILIKDHKSNKDKNNHKTAIAVLKTSTYPPDSKDATLKI